MNIDDLLHEMVDNLKLAKAGGDVKEIAAAQNALANGMKSRGDMSPYQYVATNIDLNYIDVATSANKGHGSEYQLKTLMAKPHLLVRTSVAEQMKVRMEQSREAAKTRLLSDYIQEHYHEVWVRYEADKPYSVVTRALADLGMDGVHFESREAKQLGDELYEKATELQFKCDWGKYIAQTKKVQSLKAHYADFINFANDELENSWNSDFDDSLSDDDIAWMTKSAPKLIKGS